LRVAIIGGGASGYFAAITVKENFPQSTVILFEKSYKSLAKVRISGGGRCNVTNGNTSIATLAKAYPRGSALMKQALRTFSTRDTITWFESRGVDLFTQEDMRVFPVSQNSATIVDCLEQEARRLDVHIRLQTAISAIKNDEDGLGLGFTRNQSDEEHFDKVIVATGGSPRQEGFAWLEKLGHKIEAPVPSLFTFNIDDPGLQTLSGVSLPRVQVRIPGTKLKATGPLLFTHWGLSGPAILELSAYGARTLAEMNYKFEIGVNWVDESNHERVLERLNEVAGDHERKQLINMRPFELPERLWRTLLERAALDVHRRWGELGKKGMNKLATILTNDVYAVTGKTTFKEEFVTCGGVSLDSIHPRTMESKVCRNLYFAGEVLDIDGITGGYNFQAAWTTAFIAAKLA